MSTKQQVRHVGRYAILFNHLVEQFHQRRLQDRYYLQPRQHEGMNRLAQPVQTRRDTILQVKTVFPFMLFPDSLEVDRQKVIITHRKFFGVAQIINIQISDLQAIEADVGPLFGTVLITTRQFENPIHKIYMLSRSDALKVQNVLQGFVSANKQNIDETKIESQKLTRLLKQAGSSN